MLTFLSLACCLAACSLQKDECSLLHCKGKGQVSEFLKTSHGYTYTWSLFCRVVFLYFLPLYGNYSGLEAPTLKMGFVCLLLLLLLLFFGGGQLLVFLCDVLCSWAKYSWADDMVQVMKNKMWATETLLA